MGRRIDNGLETLRESTAHADIQVPDVSRWTVGMHVHHCALGMIGICNAVLESSPPAPPSRFSAPRAFVFTTGRIPRGRGKAPAEAVPSPDIGTEDLRALLDRSESLIEQVADAAPGKWWKHFAFGVMDRDQALRFMGIHNRHHLRIVADIRAASG